MELFLFKLFGWVKALLSVKLEDVKGTVVRGAIGAGTSVGVAAAPTKSHVLEYFQAASIIGGAVVVILTVVSLAITVAWKIRNFNRPPRLDD